MNKPLGFGESMSVLDALIGQVRSCRDRVERASAEFERQRGRLEQQVRQGKRGREERVGAALAEAEQRRRNLEQQVEGRRRRREAHLGEARRRAQERALKAIAERESREVFRLQRELLSVGRHRESARQALDSELGLFLEEWQADRNELDRLDGFVVAAFQGYGAFLRLLNAASASPTPAPVSGSAALLAESRQLREEAVRGLTHFRSLVLPRIFGVLSPWLWVGLALGLHVLAVFLMPLVVGTELSWLTVGASFTAVVAVVLLVHWLGFQTGKGRARVLAAALLRTRFLLEAAHQAAHEAQLSKRQQLETETQIRTESLERAWKEATAAAEQDRGTVQEKIQKRWMQAGERLGATYAQRCADIEAAHREAIGRIEAEVESERMRGELGQGGQLRELEGRLAGELEEAVREWREGVESRYGGLVSSREAADRLFPGWQADYWDEGWRPPDQLLAAAPFGRLEVDLEQATGGLPRDSRMALPGPSRLDVPLLLRLPMQGCLLLSTRDRGREQVVAGLNNLVLRLLLSAPPGRVLFTILDPVGLGESFAGLMHLTDHEDRLINRRIWTQPDHLEQRLADLNEHVEKVTQLYLRNEYGTIADYNAQAGKIAEPYHFLVVADFPAGFSDLAVRRLLSLANSGPRCGVFSLIHWDSRRPAPLEFVPEDLRRAAIDVEVRNDEFVLAGRSMEGLRLRLEAPPAPNRMTDLLQRVGRLSVDSNRVELPFSQLVPADGELWTGSTVAELRVAVGMMGATKLQYLSLGKGTRQHALIAGKTGSGKSTLFHVLITNLSLWCSPAQVEFYLVDFKKGVEFKCYAVQRLPHARVVAIESDREFGLSVLQRVDEELHRRGDLFRQLGVQDLSGYHRASGRVLPRSLLIIDEFQEFFTEDDRISQQAALLLDRLVRQGRAFGIHVLLGSQTLGGAYTLARTTLGQMVVRIALQCSQADALLIMDDDNPAPRLLSRPGEAIYNDAAGAIEGNSPFQVAWLSEEERDMWLAKVRQRAESAAEPVVGDEPVIFEGNAPADVRENRAIHQILEAGPSEAPLAARIWLGAPNSIKGPTQATFQRQSGSNLLVVGQNDEATLGMVGLSLVMLAAQHAPGSVRLILCDATPAGTPHRRFLEQVAGALQAPVRWVGPGEVESTFIELAQELSNRVEGGGGFPRPSLFLLIHHLQRFKALRYEDDFALTVDDQGANAPGAVLNRILTEGTHLGLHVICTTDSYNNASRFLSRKALSEFELRVLFQMSASDSANLMDDPKASTLGLHRAILFNSQEGSIETFRPYALPDAAWLRGAARKAPVLARTSDGKT